MSAEIQAAVAKQDELRTKTYPALAALGSRIDKLDTSARKSHQELAIDLKSIEAKYTVVEGALSGIRKEMKGTKIHLTDLGEKLEREKEQRTAEIAALKKHISKKETLVPFSEFLFAHSWKLSEATKSGKNVLEDREDIVLRFSFPSTVRFMKHGKEFAKPGSFRVSPTAGPLRIEIEGSEKWLPPGIAKVEGAFELSKDRFRILVLDKGFPERFDPLEYPGATLYVFRRTE